MMLSRWRKEYREGKIKPDGRKRVGVMKEKKAPSGEELKELDKLKRENARLQKENDLLKKWQRYLSDRHQSDLDSSRNTDEDWASGTCAIGWVCRGVATMRGANARSRHEPEKIDAC
jgi:hypothetical protein